MRHGAEDHRAVAEPALVGELQVERGGVDVLEQPSSAADHDGHDPEVELVDEVLPDEDVVEPTRAVLVHPFSSYVDVI